MTRRVTTPQTRCRAGFARADITPPVGIYHRMWGAAVHDRATGVHRPLLATALWLESLDRQARQLAIGLDHCLLDRAEFNRIRERVSQFAAIAVEDVFVCMSHTHGSAWLSRSRSHLPGGDLIGPYLDSLAENLRGWRAKPRPRHKRQPSCTAPPAVPWRFTAISGTRTRINSCAALTPMVPPTIPFSWRR